MIEVLKGTFHNWEAPPPGATTASLGNVTVTRAARPA
jgi:hypothetical protein